MGKRLWNDLFCVEWEVKPQLKACDAKYKVERSSYRTIELACFGTENIFNTTRKDHVSKHGEKAFETQLTAHMERKCADNYNK